MKLLRQAIKRTPLSLGYGQNRLSKPRIEISEPQPRILDNFVNLPQGCEQRLNESNNLILANDIRLSYLLD